MRAAPTVLVTVDRTTSAEPSKGGAGSGPAEPAVSVITATRNAAEQLAHLVQRMRAEQGGFEWIVVDGASSDGTVDVLRASEDRITRWISEPDGGVYDAWNKGLELARGRWIIFIGADDLPGEGWISACGAAPDADLLYGDWVPTDRSGQVLGVLRGRPWHELKRALKCRMVLPHPGLAHHRRLFEDRRFDVSYRIAGDFHFLAGAPIEQALYLPYVQAYSVLGGISKRAEYVSALYQENRRVLAAFGARMPLADRVKWWLKLPMARFWPSAYEKVQRWWWRLRTRV